jgi:hypothetical protein
MGYTEAVHPKYAAYTECGKKEYNVFKRMLILDDDIIIGKNAPNIFEVYNDPTFFYAYDEKSKDKDKFNLGYDDNEELAF